MCGITGFFSHKEKIDPRIYYKAHLKIAHRGPDDEGFIYRNSCNDIEHLCGDATIETLQYRDAIYTKEPSDLIIGHRRLSIIDLSVKGHQPLSFKELYIVYNGEIYNYIELREDLKAIGYTFETKSDTEVFIKAYHCWGEAAFKKFNGMWAAAIYNRDKDELLLTRDRFGIKPLYYSYRNNTLVFGSEIKFVASFLQKLLPNERMIYDYLRFSYSDHTDETFFRDIYQVEPAHCYYFSQEGVIRRQYWELSLKAMEVHKDIDKELLDAIKLRLRSDVPVGALLSGGIDSSAIVGTIDVFRLQEEIDTFSAVFNESQFSEKKYIDTFVSKNIILRKHYIYPSAVKLLSEIDRLIYIQEEPFRSLSVYSQFIIYRYIRSSTKIKVLLNGQGADEIFSGYSEHYYYYFLTLMKEGKWSLLFHEASVFKSRRELSQWILMKELLRIGLSLFYKRKDKYHIFNSIPKQGEKVKKRFDSLLQQKLWNDLTFSALREYLRYEDKNSMAYSLESRLPFLDNRLVESAFSLTDDERIKNGISKYKLREIAKNRIPTQILERTDKMGFVSPQELWQRDDFAESFDTVFSHIKHEGIFSFINHQRVYRLYMRYAQGRMNDWGIIWRLYMVYKWKKVWKIDE